MVQTVEMTDDEQMDMYMKCSKKEICGMLIQANKHLKNLTSVTQFEDSSCRCDVSQVNVLNGNYICCTCHKPLTFKGS